jgi:hypothetical protein
MGRVVVRLDYVELRAERPDCNDRIPRVTVARVVNGEWRWRWDPLVDKGQVTVNGSPIVSGTPVVDGDVVRYTHSMRTSGSTEARFDFTAGTLELIAAEKLAPFGFAAEWLRWADVDFDLARVSFTHHSGWSLFTGPGGWQRAVSRRRGRRAFHLVPSDSVFDEAIVDVLYRHGDTVVVERRGVCTLAELIDALRIGGETVSLERAASLIRDAWSLAGIWFHPETITIDVDGQLAAFRAHASHDPSVLVGAFARLIGPDRESATQLLRRGIGPKIAERFFRHFAADWSPASVRSLLATLDEIDPTTATVAEIVEHVFPERVAAELSFAQSLRELDDANFDLLTPPV